VKNVLILLSISRFNRILLLCSKHPEVKEAADRSLQTLKTMRGTNFDLCNISRFYLCIYLPISILI
jgi:hypothetical protein